MTNAGTEDARGVADLPGWVKTSWLTALIIGIAMLILGVVLLFNLGASVETLRWLVVFSLVFAAIEAFATASLRHRPWVGWLVGLAFILGAVIGIAWPGVTLLALVITVGASLLVGGVLQTVMAWQAKGDAKGWGWSFAFGLLAAVAGLIFLFGSPVMSVLVLALVLAFYVIMTGATLIGLALAVRRAARDLSSGLGPAAA